MKKEYLVALVYSIFGSLGFYCIFSWYCITAFNEIGKYPYLYPFSIIMGLICIIVCIINLIINVMILKNNKNSIIITLLNEIVIVLITYIPFLILWEYFLNFIGHLF